MVRHTQSSVDICGVNGGSKTVVSVVADLDSFFLILELLDGHDGAENLFVVNLHVLGDVGEDGGVDEVTCATNSVATNGQGSTFLLAVLDVFHDSVKLDLGDLWALEGLRVERIADLVGSGTFLETLDELVVDALLDEDARASTAALAVVKEDAKVGPRDSVVNVCVIKNNVGGLATELECRLLQVALSSGFQDQTADVGGSSESNLVDIHVVGKSGTGHTTSTRNDVEHTRWESSLLNECGSIQSGQWCLLGWLHDNHITSGKCRSDLPRQHHQRKVPWDNLPANTNWLVASVHKGIRVGIDSLTMNLVGPSTVVAQARNRTVNIYCLSHTNCLAIVDGFDSRENFRIALEEIGQLMKKIATLSRGVFAPFAVESLACSSDSNVDILFISLVKSNDGLFVCRVVCLECLAIYTLVPFIVDEPVISLVLENR